MSQEAYDKARKIGLRTARNRQAEGLDPYLPALDEIEKNVVRKEELRAQPIPMERIVGTKTNNRTNAFACDFMPLLDAYSEFAAKWMRLYDSQLEEGIRDAITCYEYKNRYYVQEGNKRVSVLKYLQAPEIMAKVVRLLPERDGSPEVEHYYEFLDFSKKSGLLFLEFSQPGSYSRFGKLLHADKDGWSEELKKDVRSAYYRFVSAFEKTGGQAELGISVGDAFLLFLDVYGLEDFDEVGSTELEKQLEKLREDFRAYPDKPAPALKTDSEEDKPSLLGSILSESVKAGFIHAKDPETSAWTRHHEEGRQYLEQVVPNVKTMAWFHADDAESEMKAMEEAFKAGCNVIFTTSPQMLRSTIKFGARHPEVKIFNCSLHTRTGHIRTYFDRGYESQFLTGLIAGILSKSGKISYIADYPIYGSIASLNAFAVGARMVNPDAKIYLDWSTTRQATQVMPDDIDFTFIAGQSFDPKVKNSVEFGLYDIGASKFLNLTRDVQYWGEFYSRIARKIQNNSWKNEWRSGGHSVNYWWGIGNGMTDIELSDKLPVQTRSLVEVMKEALRQGYDPFETELRDQAGELKSAKGQSYGARNLIDMDWLADNIVGTIPALEDFTEDAAAVIKSHGLDKVRGDSV